METPVYKRFSSWYMIGAFLLMHLALQGQYPKEWPGSSRNAFEVNHPELSEGMTADSVKDKSLLLAMESEWVYHFDGSKLSTCHWTHYTSERIRASRFHELRDKTDLLIELYKWKFGVEPDSYKREIIRYRKIKSVVQYQVIEARWELTDMKVRIGMNYGRTNENEDPVIEVYIRLEGIK